MKEELVAVMESCAEGAVGGTMTFPEVVGKLMGIGVERYHADYSRGEITYYLPEGGSHVVGVAHGEYEMGGAFLGEVVAAAVVASQRGEHTYKDFVRKTMGAGCVGYFVQISGKQVIYFGRKGEVHVERFPGV